MTHAPTPAAGGDSAVAAPIVELEDIGKSYGAFHALTGVNMQVTPGTVTCVLGDNGAGKSTLIKILSGLHKATEGTIRVDGTPMVFANPRQALDQGIATVYQDLAVVGTMPVWRNFFLGQEITKGPFGLLDRKTMRRTAHESLAAMGIDLPDIDVQLDKLSGGQRQVVAIARAIHFGARVVVLDEPTAALGVKQSGMVLHFVAEARKKGLAIILITHNPHHAWLVGDTFMILKLGKVTTTATRDTITLEELTLQMAGGGELDSLAHELQR